MVFQAHAAFKGLIKCLRVIAHVSQPGRRMQGPMFPGHLILKISLPRKARVWHGRIRTSSSNALVHFCKHWSLCQTQSLHRTNWKVNVERGSGRSSAWVTVQGVGCLHVCGAACLAHISFVFFPFAIPQVLNFRRWRRDGNNA